MSVITENTTIDLRVMKSRKSRYLLMEAIVNNNTDSVESLLNSSEIRKLKLLDSPGPDCAIGQYLWPSNEAKFFKMLKHKIFIQRLLNKCTQEMKHLLTENLYLVPSVWDTNHCIPKDL